MGQILNSFVKNVDREVINDESVKTTLETLPEELSLEIIANVMNFADNSGRMPLARPTGPRSRDSALRSVSLTSRRLYSFWFPSLIQNLTISWDHLASIDEMLCRNQNRLFVKLLYCFHEPDFEEDPRKLTPDDWMKTCVIRRDHDTLRASVFEKLIRLESLIILDPNFLFDFVQRVNGKTVPIRFLTHSLKKLYLPLVGDPHSIPFVLSLTNATWLLIFCTQLRQASLSFTINTNDYKFLQDNQDILRSFNSKVKDLSLMFIFIHLSEDRSTWWSSSAESNQSWIGRNKKTETIYRLLEVTTELEALEVSFQYDESNPGDYSLPNLSCLSGAYSSLNSLTHLRIFEIGPDVQDLTSADLTGFKNLKVLSSNFAHWDRIDINQVQLPPSLEIISVDFYNFEEGMSKSQRFAEESRLLKILNSGSFPSLKEVVVPATPHHSGGNDIYPLSEQDRNLWVKIRKATEQASVLKSGQAKLRTFRPGESIVDGGETPMSSLIWHNW